MSLLHIRRALEKRLQTLSGQLPTAWENGNYTPKIGTAYQAVSLLPAETVSDTFATPGHNLAKYVGLLQVALRYPVNQGSSDATSKAEAVLDHFYRGLTLSEGGLSVIIPRRGSISPALIDGSWYTLVVSIPYRSFVFGT